MSELTRRRFMLTGALASAGLVTGCVSATRQTTNGQRESALLGQQHGGRKMGGSNMGRKVSFERDGVKLVGNLFTPVDFEKNRKYNAVIVAGSLTSVKEQMAGTYASKFAEQGFVAIAIDYSHYGESEGVPRQFESPEVKLSDLKAAVTYTTDLPYVKAVGMVGVCTSGGNAAYLAANDQRIKAVATVAGFLPDPTLNMKMFGEAEIRRRREAGASARLAYERTGEQIVVPAYSYEDKSAVNYRPSGSGYDYYFSKSRGGVPEWKNEFAVMSYEPFLNFDPVSKASAIKVPTIVVHSDGSAFPDQAKKFFDAIGGVKELAWGTGTHFDYYDQPAQVDYAVKNVTQFFQKHLA